MCGLRKPHPQDREGKGAPPDHRYDVLEKVIDEVMKANPGQLAQYRGGKEKLFGFFVGQAMKMTKGKANPALVNELLRKKLSA